MPKKFIRRFLPSDHSFKSHKALSFLGDRLHNPNLWHLNRRSVSGAFANGLFMAFMPFPAQMAMAAIVALFSRINLPVSVALVWITNPITIPPMFYFAYRVGAWILNVPVGAGLPFEFSYDWLMTELGAAWQPFVLGCFVVATCCSLIGYFSVRIVWRIIVQRSWQQRKLRRFLRRKKTEDQAD